MNGLNGLLELIKERGVTYFETSTKMSSSNTTIVISIPDYQNYLEAVKISRNAFNMLGKHESLEIIYTGD